MPCCARSAWGAGSDGGSGRRVQGLKLGVKCAPSRNLGVLRFDLCVHLRVTDPGIPPVRMFGLETHSFRSVSSHPKGRLCVPFSFDFFFSLSLSLAAFSYLK